MIPFSPGVLVGTFELLRLVDRAPIALREIPGAFSRLGGVPIKEVFSAAQELNWLEADTAGIAELTAAGHRLVGLGTYQSQLRVALFDYIDAVRPAWLQAASQGRMRVRAFAGNAIAQVIDEAGLSTGNDKETVAFWDALAARARGLRNDRLTEIGRAGERLTIAHERQRTGRDPKWVALDNNADGYDVLSIVGADDPRPLSIEVKATTMFVGGEFHITANEWQRASDAEAHIFHLWRIKSNDEATLTVTSPADLAMHIPVNQGEGTWESAVVPFSVFASSVRTI